MSRRRRPFLARFHERGRRGAPARARRRAAAPRRAAPAYEFLPPARRAAAACACTYEYSILTMTRAVRRFAACLDVLPFHRALPVWPTGRPVDVRVPGGGVTVRRCAHAAVSPSIPHGVLDVLLVVDRYVGRRPGDLYSSCLLRTTASRAGAAPAADQEWASSTADQHGAKNPVTRPFPVTCRCPGRSTCCCDRCARRFLARAWPFDLGRRARSILAPRHLYLQFAQRCLVPADRLFAVRQATTCTRWPPDDLAAS